MSPDGLGLGFDPFLSVKDGHRTIEHSERPLDFNGEVDVAGGVDQVDLVVHIVEGPRAGRRRGLDRDATLLFLLEEVHRRRAFMHFADLVVHAGVEQDALCDGGFASVDVGADADIADAGEVDGHRCFLELSLGLGEPRGSLEDHVPIAGLDRGEGSSETFRTSGTLIVFWRPLRGGAIRTQ